MAPIKEVSASVLAAEIEELDDNELFAMLRDNNIAAGPIVASTRPLYQKKLIRLLSNETESVVHQLQEDYDENEDYEEEEEYQESPGLRNRFTTDATDHGHVEKKEEFVPTTRRKLNSYEDDDITEIKTKNKGMVSRTWTTIVWSIKLMAKLIMLWLLVCAVYYIYTNHLADNDPINKMQESIQKAANEANEGASDTIIDMK